MEDGATIRKGWERNRFEEQGRYERTARHAAGQSHRHLDDRS